MKGIQPYLNFDGTTKEAMTFYKECLGGTLELQTFADVKMKTEPGGENRTMHARLASGPVVIMASDTMPGMTLTQGNNVWINIECESVDEIEKLFAAFSQGGKVVMPLADQFWGARFGMLTDKFGTQWMFNCELKK